MCKWIGLIIFIIYGIDLIVSQSAIPQSNEQQQTKSDKEDYSDIAISSSRGGCNNQTPSLSWIVPPQSERMTTKSPYVLLHLESQGNSLHSTADITISLSNSQTKKTVYRKNISVESEAHQFIPVPLDEVKLDPVVDYIITVMLVCDPLKKSANPWKRGLIKRFVQADQLQNQLLHLTSDLEQAKLLKENQVGYDAIKKTFNYYTNRADSKLNKRQLLQTLNQL